MLGISLYPDKTTLAEDEVYLTRAYALGYRRVFTSLLQIDPANPEGSMARVRESCCAAHDRGFSVTLDIHPRVFGYLHIAPNDLAYFHDMGVTTLRLDEGFGGETVASMTRNAWGIGIELNMSVDNPMLDLVESYGADGKHLSGSFNFYPQRYTGMPLEAFQRAAARYRAHHLRSAAFITAPSARVSPWPVCEGNCTLEMHRDLPIRLQARHLKMLNLVDDWIVGNAYASLEELSAVAEEYHRARPVIGVELDPAISAEERALLLENVQCYRGDCSPYMIRSCAGRLTYGDRPLPAHLNRSVQRGDVLVLNEDYGQYRAEVQLALKDRPADPRVNVVGRVVAEEAPLIDALRPYEEFELVEAAPDGMDA